MSRKHGPNRRSLRSVERWWPPSEYETMVHNHHLANHPGCTFAFNDPHFIPPSFGEPGFFLCDQVETTPHVTADSGGGGK